MKKPTAKQKLQLSVFGLVLVLVLGVWFAKPEWLGGFKSSITSPVPPEYVISQSIDGEWQEVAREDFEVEYETRQYDLSPRDELKIRIVHRGGDFADVEQVELQACGDVIVPQYARYLESGEDLLLDLLEDDLNVVIAQDKEIEMAWKMPRACSESPVLSVNANAYGHAKPFRYPERTHQHLTYQFGSNPGSLEVDGLIDEVDGSIEPDYSPLWEPVTGHPDGETHIYMSDDADYVYVTLDITMDNTDEEGEDWAEVVVEGRERKTFRIDDSNSDYGLCGFGMTSAVDYKHQTCEFAIPKSELPEEAMLFSIGYYGTGGGGGPGNWVLDATDAIPSGPVLGASAVAYNNLIYLFGGYDDDTGDTLDNVQIYDPSQAAGARWSTDTTDPMPAERTHGGAVLVGTNIYYLLGRSDTGTGNLEDDVFIYNPAAADGARWTTGTAAGGANARHSFAYAANGTDIYIIGGMDNTMGAPTFYSDVFEYDTVGDSWDTATLTDMPVARGRITGQNIGGVIYVAGGGSTDLRTYTVGTDTWGTGAAFTGGYSPLAPCSAQNSTDFYVISHRTEEDTYRYDTVGNSWTQTENLNEIRMRCAATNLNGTLYTFGGFDDGAGDYWDDFETLLVASIPLAPTINYPDDTATRAGVTVLSAQYLHSSSTTGTTDYRVSNSAANCLAGASLEASGTSAATATANEPTFFNAGTLTSGTKHWCARNDDGGTQTAWTTMGSFIVDSTAPYLNYGTYFGGTNNENTVAGIQFHNDMVYIAGTTFSGDFPATVGAFDTVLNNASAGFLAVFSLDGAGLGDLEYATFFEPITNINDIFVDSSGVYIVGQTNSVSFPTAGGAGGTPYDGTGVHAPSTANAFISRFNLTLSTLEYSTYFGSTLGFFDDADAIKVASGLAYVGGSASDGHPTTAGAYDTTHNGSQDFYVSVFNLAGNGATDLQYSTYVGGGGFEEMRDLEVNAGMIYVGGSTDTGSFPTTAGAFDTVKGGFGAESVLSVINPAGGGATDLVYSTYVGGSSTESISNLVYDTASSTILGCGGTGSADFFTTAGAYDTTNTGGFVFQLNPAGGGTADMVYSSFLGTGVNGCGGIEFENGDVYMLISSTAGLATTTDAYGRTTATEDAIMRMDLGGNGASDLIYSSYFGTAAFMTTGSPILYIVGSTNSVLEPILADPGGSPYDSTPDGNSDAVIFRMEFQGGAVPDAITDLVAIAGDAEIDLGWTAPNDNGSAITDYQIEFREFPGGTFSTFVDGVSTLASATVTGLTNGQEYEFRVSAINGIGTGPVSNLDQEAPLSLTSGRREFPEGGPRFFLGQVRDESGKRRGLLRGSAQVDLVNELLGERYQTSGGAIGIRSFANDQELINRLSSDRTELLQLIDLIMALRVAYNWMDPADYELLGKHRPLAQKYQKLFLTRFFHHLIGVEYLERGALSTYEFDYKNPTDTETEILVDFARSTLLTVGRACYDPTVLDYAEELDYPGSNNWYVRYVEVLRPWFTELLGTPEFSLIRPMDDVSVLDSYYLLLFGFCLGEELGLEI